ncbi:hypothetical protein GW796_05805 [archaeon]|nr:hypothetical protein [archaeon]NCQ51399.1 hypothetical protein [archaeon]NCT58775.1 hypothetical protein [archaeon]
MALQKYDQLKFIHLLNIEGIHKVNNNFNGRCPVCGDSRKSKYKKRLWFLTDKLPDTILVFCHNCNLSTNLREFIKLVDPLVFEEYLKEEKEDFLNSLKEGKLIKKEKSLKINIDNLDIKYKFTLNKEYFKPAKNYKKAIEFCKKRNILDKLDTLYYNINEKSILKGMLIFPFLLGDERLYGFQGRHTENKNFHVFCKNDSFKSCGIFHVNKKKPIIAVESIIDHYNIENSIAMVGSDLTVGVKKYFENSRIIYGFDNDKTGILKSLKYCDNNCEVFVWPNEIKYKDFNDLSVNGWSNKKVKQLILDNCYAGIELKTRLTFKNMRKER